MPTFNQFSSGQIWSSPSFAELGIAKPQLVKLFDHMDTGGLLFSVDWFGKLYSSLDR